MVKLIPVKYWNKSYPREITPKLIEVPAHFDVKDIQIPRYSYSLHTEYSYYPRKFNSKFTDGLFFIKNSVIAGGIPKLWYDEDWVSDFQLFLTRLIGENHPPEIVEIHPPYNDYSNIERFIEIYSIFEHWILEKYPKTNIVIENRYGSRYSKGDFIISKLEDMIEITGEIEKNKLKLRFVLDLPQLFTAEGIDIGSFTKANISYIFEKLMDIRAFISGIHIWGKCYGKNGGVAAHAGTLDSYFFGLSCDEITFRTLSLINRVQSRDIKDHFLKNLYNLLDDGKVRYFVPEVNSKSEHLHIIVKDMIEYGFEFV